jgi:hypothetical protein
MKRITTLLAAAALTLAISVPAVLASGGDGIRISLTAAKAFPPAKGSATFKARDGERQFEAEVEHVRRLAGRTVVFYVGGKKVAAAKVGRFGTAQIERRGSRAPAVASGTTVRVKTASGKLVVRGSF